MASMGYDFTAWALPGKHKSYVDAAFLGGAWRYTRLLGSSGYKIINSKRFFSSCLRLRAAVQVGVLQLLQVLQVRPYSVLQRK